MKTLAEWIQVDASEEEGTEAPQPHVGLVVDNLVAAWGGIAYAELSVLLVHLKYLALVHQTHHWIARGDSFWGDHKLFEELYDTVNGEIDKVAEKGVGLGNETNVALPLIISQMAKLSTTCGSSQTVPQSSELAKTSLVAEWNFLKILCAVSESLKANGTNTPGVENMLQGLFDTHEKHIYLLKRRAACAPLGL